MVYFDFYFFSLHLHIVCVVYIWTKLHQINEQIQVTYIYGADLAVFV